MKQFKKLTLLSVAVSSAMVLSACSNGSSVSKSQNNGSKTPTTPVTPTTNPTKPINTQSVIKQTRGIVFEEKPAIVKKIRYTMRHFTNHSQDNILDYIQSGNIIKLPNETYQVGDTIEFKDTIVKINSVVSADEYSIIPASMFDVFNDLEIDGKLQVAPQTAIQSGLSTSPVDILKMSEEQIKKIFDDLKSRNCLPHLDDVTLHGQSHLHTMGNGKFNGKSLSLQGCELYSSDSVKITTDQTIGVGMLGDIVISKENKTITLALDGAMLLAGKIFVEAEKQDVINTRLMTFEPAIYKSIPPKEAETLRKLLTAEIYINLKTLIGGKFKGNVGTQVPADFAIGIKARYDENQQKWNTQQYKLKNGKMFQLDTSVLGAGYHIDETAVKVGSALDIGYNFSLSAETPWFPDDEQNDSWWSNFLRDTKAGFTADLDAVSRAGISAGLVVDAHAGSSIPVENCKANLDSLVGYYGIHSFIFRAGDRLFDYQNFDTKHTIFGANPIKVASWDLFDRFKLKKEDWCGPKSKLSNAFGVNQSKILMTDRHGKILMTSEYVMDWKKPMQTGLVVANSNNTNNNILNATKVVQEAPLPLNSHGITYNLEFIDKSSGFDINDSRWRFNWKTINPDVKLENTNGRIAFISTQCTRQANQCSTAPVTLSITTPDKQIRYVQFKPQFVNILGINPKASYNSETLNLSVGINHPNAKYTWTTRTGKLLQTMDANLSVPAISDFYRDALVDKKVQLVYEVNGEVGEKAVNLESVSNEITTAVNNLVGYWKSKCLPDLTNSYYGSRQQYLEIAKKSDDSASIERSHTLYYKNSNCSGEIAGSGTSGNIYLDDISNDDLIFLTKDYLPIFTSKNSFYGLDKHLNNDNAREGYNRITQSEFEGFYQIVDEIRGNDKDALILPNGGEKWYNGQKQTISWMNQYITGQKVDLYVLHDNPIGLTGTNKNRKDIGKTINQKKWLKFASKVPNTGKFELDPKIMSGNGNAYLVLVVSTTDKSKFDISDNTFSLNE